MGLLKGFFAGKSDLRQGNLVSPCSFVLAIEVYTACLQNATSHPKFKYNWKTKATRITSLFFADDVILFSRGDQVMVLLSRCFLRISSNSLQGCFLIQLNVPLFQQSPITYHS